MTLPHEVARPLAIGIIRAGDDDRARDRRHRQVQFIVDANTLGYTIVYVFHAVGDPGMDGDLYEMAEELALEIDAEAFIVTVGINWRKLSAIADRVRMRVHQIDSPAHTPPTSPAETPTV